MRLRDARDEIRVSPRAADMHREAGYDYCRGFGAYVRVVLLSKSAKGEPFSEWLQIDFSPHTNTRLSPIPKGASLCREWEQDQLIERVVRGSIMSHINLDTPDKLVVDGLGQVLSQAPAR